MKKYLSSGTLGLLGLMLTPVIALGQDGPAANGRTFEPLRSMHGQRFAASEPGKSGAREGQGRGGWGGGPGGPGGQAGPGGPGGGRGMMNRTPNHRKLGRYWRALDELADEKQPLNKAQARKLVAMVKPYTTRKTLSEAEAGKLADQIYNVLTVAQKKVVQEEAGPGRFGGRGDGRGGGRDGGRDGRGPGGPGGGGFGRRDGNSKDGKGPGGPGGGGFGRRDGNGKDGKGPGGPGRPGGQGGPGGFDRAKMEKLRSFLENINPFYNPAGYAEFKQMPERMQERMKDRYEDNREILEKLYKLAR